MAAWFLRLKGYRIACRNFRCRSGEIDIVARKRGLLIFVEVRTRTAGALLQPLQTVDPVKVARTVNAAKTFLAGLPRPLPACRFDVIAITTGRHRTARKIVHLRNAFDVTSEEYREGCRREAKRKKFKV
jgi:putative endonuclease